MLIEFQAKEPVIEEAIARLRMQFPGGCEQDDMTNEVAAVITEQLEDLGVMVTSVRSQIDYETMIRTMVLAFRVQVEVEDDTSAVVAKLFGA